VVGQLEAAASMVAFVFGGLSDESWYRECLYDYPEPSQRSLAWLAVHTLHEGEHHLVDVARRLTPQQTPLFPIEENNRGQVTPQPDIAFAPCALA